MNKFDRAAFNRLVLSLAPAHEAKAKAPGFEYENNGGPGGGPG